MTTKDNALSLDGPARDKWGRPLVVPPGGGKAVAYTRCTTYVDALEDKYNLGQWQKRMVAFGMGKRADLVLGASAVDDPSSTTGKKTLDSLAEQAMQAAQAGAAATIGTALHAFTERVDRGLSITDVPEVARPDIEAYQRATAEIEPLLIETFTVHDELKIGGTPDRVAQYRGRTYIADVKTGSIEYGAGKFAMQLAVYARSVQYTPENARRTPLPSNLDPDMGILIHLPAGEATCTVYWLDLAAGWEAVQHATWVRKWRNRKDFLSPFEQPDETSAALRRAVARASTLDELRDIYTWYVMAGLGEELVTAVCTQRIAELGRAA